MKRTLLAVLGAVSLSACAQGPEGASAGTEASAPVVATTTRPAPAPAAGTADARALEAVRTLNANLNPEHIGQAPLPGFREVIVAGQVVYVSDDGRYMFLPGQGGALYDTVAEENLSEAAFSTLRRDLLKTIPEDERIVFAPANPKYHVTVFTDVECGYCRKMHNEIADYNAQGIAIEYLAFPRMGIGSEDYNKMVAVWCSADRKKALTDAKNDRAVNAATDCKNTVTMQYSIGQRVGLTGTPMILTEDGTQVGGYVPPAALRELLDKRAAEAGADAPSATSAAAAESVTAG